MKLELDIVPPPNDSSLLFRARQSRGLQSPRYVPPHQVHPSSAVASRTSQLARASDVKCGAELPQRPGTYLALSPTTKNPPPIQHRRELFFPSNHQVNNNQPSSLCRNVRRSSREGLYTPPNTSQDVLPEGREGLWRGACTFRSPEQPQSPSRKGRAQMLTAPGHTEDPQDQDHPVLAQGQVPREGLGRAPRARQEQGPPRQGPRPPAHQVPQDHHPQDPQR